MKILITGATGFIGKELLRGLFLSGIHDIRILTRSREKAKTQVSFPIEIFEWDPGHNFIEEGAVEDVDCIVHLAGENVTGARWSKDKKQRILESRFKGTKLLIDTISNSGTTPAKFLSASAVGIYGNRGEERIDKFDRLGDGFLADVCKQWESIALDSSIDGMKSAVIRFGVVLGQNGGAFKKMLPAFRFGVAGPLGTGNQYMSWIHIDDLVGQIKFLLENDFKNKIYNGVSPRPVTNYIFTKVLGKELGRPTFFKIPQKVLSLILGDMSQIVTDSQKVIPVNFMDEGYQYKFRGIKDAVRDILKHSSKGEYQFENFQWVHQESTKVFNFFSDEKNLEQITPKSLRFKVVGKSTDQIEVGTVINYKLNVHGVPLNWRSRISSFEFLKQFVDEQEKGPFGKWVHTHQFLSVKNGTLIRDEVVYKLPFGIVGKLVAGKFVNSDVVKIFKYRNDKINQTFF